MEKYCVEILKTIGNRYLISEDGEYINFLNEDAKGNLLLQDKKDCIIVWNNDIKNLTTENIYKLLLKVADKSLVFPYVDEDEKKIITKLGGEKFDFAKNYPHEDSLCTDYSHTYGSYIIKK